MLFESEDPNKPAKFYSLSAPAHKNCETVYIDINKAKKIDTIVQGRVTKYFLRKSNSYQRYEFGLCSLIAL